MSFGLLSRFYENIKRNSERKQISTTYGLSPETLESLLQHCAYVRNLCAHHARLWNRQFSIKPKVMKAYMQQMSRNHTFYAQAALLYVLMYIIADGSKWQRRLMELLAKHPNINLRAMGFPPDWQHDPFWRLT